LTKFENHFNYNCEITTDTNEKYRVYANWLHNNKLNSWHGWSCEVGATRFYIDKNFDVWAGMCKNDYLGNALTGWELKSDNVCNQPICNGCTDDLLTAKHARL
jgi:hypothetical protein